MKRLLLILLALFVIYSPKVFAQDEWQPVTDPVKIFQEGYIQVIGSSEEGQSRYRALRAATVVAQRDMLEVIQGLTLYGHTTVKDGMLESDEIKTSVHGMLRGAVKCGEKYYPDKGYAEVCLRLYIRGHGSFYDVILPLMKEKHLLPPPAPEYRPKLIPKVINEQPQQPAQPQPQSETATQSQQQPAQPQPEQKPQVAAPSKLENPYDGLVVDVREYSFRPALVNRILTEDGSVIFDPSKIINSVLVERGCGGFTNDKSKALALLKTWGSNHPMLIKAVGVSNYTDVKVNKDDAAAIYVNNEKTQFLNQAKVVFLLK